MSSENRKQRSVFHLYGGDDLLRSLKNGRLSLQTDWSLLQPFLSFAQWHDDKQQPVTEQEIQSALKAHYNQLPQAIRSLLTYEDFLQQRAKLEPDIRQSISQQRRSTVQGYAHSRLERAALLRLYASALNDQVWRLQGDNYRGICVCLRNDASLLTAKKGYPALVKPVSYGQAHDVMPTKENPVPGAFMGPEAEASDAEWRLVLPRAEGEVPTVRLAKGDVARIYVGPSASDELLASVRHLIRFDQRFRNCDLMRVVPDLSHWKLTAQPLPVTSDDQ